MQNILETVTNAMKSLIDDEPKSPLHIGEAMSCWFYLTGLQEAIVFEEAGLNMTTDDKLINMLEDSIKMCESQVETLKRFMQNEGVPLPPVSPGKPKSESEAIPLGVKLSDSELANGVAIKVATAITSCATAMSQSIRDDLGIMWVQFQAGQLTYGAKLKQLMKKRGWLKVPPYYYPPGLPRE